MCSKGLGHGSVFLFSMKMRSIPKDEIEPHLIEEDENSIEIEESSMIDDHQIASSNLSLQSMDISTPPI